jgi:hypothetical protein
LQFEPPPQLLQPHPPQDEQPHPQLPYSGWQTPGAGELTGTQMNFASSATGSTTLRVAFGAEAGFSPQVQARSHSLIRLQAQSVPGTLMSVDANTFEVPSEP